AFRRSHGEMTSPAPRYAASSSIPIVVTARTSPSERSPAKGARRALCLRAVCGVLVLRLVWPVTFLVFLPGIAPARLIAPRLFLSPHRLRLLVFAVAARAVPVPAAAAGHRELAHLVLAQLGGLPPAGEPRVILGDLAHPVDERRHVVVDRVH